MEFLYSQQQTLHTFYHPRSKPCWHGLLCCREGTWRWLCFSSKREILHWQIPDYLQRSELKEDINFANCKIFLKNTEYCDLSKIMSNGTHHRLMELKRGPRDQKYIFHRLNPLDWDLPQILSLFTMIEPLLMSCVIYCIYIRHKVAWF